MIRRREWEKLENCLDQNTTGLIIVNGRQRVGKTYLMDSFFQGKYTFQITGVENFRRKTA